MIKRHQKLLVWQEAMKLAESVYALSRQLPREELFVLTAQLRKCAVSVPSNIAEGASRHSDKEMLRFLNIAKGSLAEMETQILLCERLYSIEWCYEDTKRKIEDVFALNESLRRRISAA
ncbi:MAG: four helix bundle protein [Oleiphilaceae bacterium]|nr:four helix bundle protein [Oleiphilaceae bacterium]